MDEKQEALSILERKDLGYRPSESICILAKYYLYAENQTKEQVEESIISFIRDKTKINYKPSDWQKCIDKNIKRATKYPLIKIDKVLITKTEIEIIRSLKRKPVQKIAFTLLCLAKYHNQISDKNNNWTNCSLYQIFKLANVSSKTRNNRLEMIHELYRLELIKFSKKNTNTNICVNYIHDESDTAIEITKICDLGKEYALHCGEKYIRCSQCGRLISKGKNGKVRYCKECAESVNREKTRERMNMLRHQDV